MREELTYTIDNPSSVSYIYAYTNGASPNTWGTNLRGITSTYPQIPYISLACHAQPVYDREIGSLERVSKEVQHNKRDCVCHLNALGQL